ncbi:DNA-binding transcriptional regulator of glucitol operon [Prauserella marina]|uniref:DNA-binding transcriptional regulator of glucitol operon n=1 Tax=Prauserella marina TaxID=530584 RepID=A0A1G6J393_9PSEU|nr:DNA-binding transcriptional regulator of glucitol operon [Prauserella marina]SDC13191.1 DNA-binding transcriptional regulator of glucitol operon [Prauserella marina]
MTNRLAIVGVSALSLVICCGLAWWQWERFSSAGGSFQNLGYVLQWPLFGLFPAFMFWRIRKLNKQAKAAEQAELAERTERDAEAEVPDMPQQRAETRPPATTARTVGNVEIGEADAGQLDPEDAELAAYNRYLAELNARDQEVK